MTVTAIQHIAFSSRNIGFPVYVFLTVVPEIHINNEKKMKMSKI